MVKYEVYTFTDGTEIPVNLPFSLNEKDYRTESDQSKTKKVFNFVGFCIQQNKLLFVFPKSHNLESIDEHKSFWQLFSVISKHIEKNPELYINKSDFLASTFPFNAFSEVYKYYKRFGLFRQIRVEHRIGYNGNISWKRTVQHSTKIVSNGVLVMLPFQIKDEVDYSNFISECMVFSINYTIERFSFILKLNKIPNAVTQSRIFDNKEFVINKLQQIKVLHKKDISLRLINSLIDFFSQINNGGNYQFKHYNFSIIWESMVENYLNRYFSGVENDRLLFSSEPTNKYMFKKTVFFPNHANPTQRIYPDHYVCDNSSQFIFDSKYYIELTAVDYKQLSYYFILSNVSTFDVEKNTWNKKNIKTFNALILPGNKNDSVNFEFKIAFNPNEYNNNFRVLETYLDVAEMMKIYLT